MLVLRLSDKLTSLLYLWKYSLMQKKSHGMLWITSGRKNIVGTGDAYFRCHEYKGAIQLDRQGPEMVAGHLFSIPALNPIKNQKGFDETIPKPF